MAETISPSIITVVTNVMRMLLMHYLGNDAVPMGMNAGTEMLEVWINNFIL